MLSKVINLYEGREDVTLTTYVIDDSPEMLKGAKRPAILICPGGAYLGCSDREAEPVALRFASMGYHAFVLRYSVYFEGKPGVLKPGEKYDERKEHCIHPNPMREIGKSMLIIREHTEQWKVDTDKIILCGFSAGAHNCAMFSVNWNKPVIYDYFKQKPEVFKPAAAILGYMVSDFYMHKQTNKEESVAALAELVNLALTGNSAPNDETFDEISPVFHVSENTPPMFLWTTSEDALVPAENTTKMATALACKKIPFELHIFEKGPHGLSLADQSTAGIMGQIDKDAAKWVPLAECWLNKRFALQLPEKAEWEN